MGRLAEAYTRYPRTLLWLIRGGSLVWREANGATSVIEVESFYLSKVPVTNEQFEAFDPGFLRASSTPGDDAPAVGVSYNEACAYCAWYAEISRKPMRLPTVYEWRWACAGETAAEPEAWPRGTRLDELAWHAGNSGLPVGPMPRLAARRHNDFGLYGMLGGLWDWTSTEASISAAGASPQDEVVLRWQCGGSYRTLGTQLNPELRRPVVEGQRDDDVGFRVVKPMRG
jgi:formylglycine-generating enzyme required for sulfatase activity